MTLLTPERTDRSLADCPECRTAGSVVEAFCEVCYAEFDEVHEAPGAAVVSLRGPAASRYSENL